MSYADQQIKEIVELCRERGIILDKYAIYGVRDHDDYYEVVVDGLIEVWRDDR